MPDTIFNVVTVFCLFILVFASLYHLHKFDKEENEYRKKLLDYLDQILKKIR